MVISYLREHEKLANILVVDHISLLNTVRVEIGFPHWVVAFPE
jgi:hypothetical protein